MIRRLRAVGGLATDPSALENPEALRVAENVLMHRPGIIQPRIGFGETDGLAARSTSYRPVAIIPWNDDVVVFSSDGGGNYRLEKGAADTQYTGSVALMNSNLRGRPGAMKARGSLYVTSATGIKKLAAFSDSALTRAGVWMTYEPITYSFIDPGASSGRDAILSGSSVAYRWVVRRTDANGYIARSAPSARAICRVTSGAFANGARVELGSIGLPSEAVAGDVIELYRTRNTGSVDSDPGEDYYLAATYTITSANIVSQSISSSAISDDVKDDALGAALYTSSSQFGALASKEVPPLTHDLAWWGNCAWAAATQERRTLRVWLQKVACDAATNQHEGSGLCYNDNGSYAGVSGNSLTGVTFGVGGFGWSTVAVGMWVSDSSPTTTTGRIPVPARIVSFNSGAGTITLDVAPSGSGTFNIGDIVTVNSTEFYAYSTESTTLRWFDVDIGDTDPEDRAYETALSLCRVICNYAAKNNVPTAYALKDETSVGGTGEFFLIGNRPENTTLSITCSMRGAAFAPNITSAYSATTGSSPGRVAWSALDEPEAWPPAQSAIVGDQSKSVLRLIPTDRCLLVWKEDGLFAVSGSPPGQLIIDEVESDIRLITADSACSLAGVCFGFTDRGVVAATNAGVQIISGDIADQLRTPQQLARSTVGLWLVPHRRLGLVILGVADDDDSPTHQFVYSIHTRRWAKWTRPFRCAAYDDYQDNDRMLVGLFHSAWTVVAEWGGDEEVGSYIDASLSSLSATITGTQVVVAIASFGAYTPAVGDVLETSSVYRRITAVSSGGGNYTFTVDATGLSGVSVNWLQSIPSVLEWQAQHLPGSGARWEEMHAAFQLSTTTTLSSPPIDLGGYSQRDTSVATVTPNMATHATNVKQSQIVRVGVPRDVVRAAHFFPYLKTNTAGTLWQLSELNLHHSETSRRVSR